MRIFYFLFIFIFSISGITAQRSYEAGLYLGGANYYGEIGSKSFVSPDQAFYGLIGKINFSQKLALRGTFTFVTLADNDRDSNSPYRANGRNDGNTYFSFENNNIEASLALEYTPFEFFITSTFSLSPYVFTGLNVLYGDELYYPTVPASGDIAAIDYGSTARLSLPIGIGVKTFISPNFLLGVELAPRYTFTDNLDGTGPEDPPAPARNLSYTEENDWYTYVGLTLTYRWGDNRTDCYCW